MLIHIRIPRMKPKLCSPFIDMRRRYTSQKYIIIRAIYADDPQKAYTNVPHCICRIFTQYCTIRQFYRKYNP